MSAISARRNGEVTLKVLSNLRNEESFRLFYNKVVTFSKSYAFEKGPRLSRKRRVPPRFEIGSGENSYPETPEDHYRTIYYEVLDVIMSSIDERFNQPGFQVYANAESLLVKSLKRP